MFLKKNNKIKFDKIPEHIAIIMDGNGRWAQKKGLPRTAGHSSGAKTFRTIARHCSSIGVKYLTVYAFSTENWKRPSEEVTAIMNLFRNYLKEAIEDFKNENMIIRFIGDRSILSDDLTELMNTVETFSADKKGMILNIAINYGGRSEIINAVKKIYKDVKNNKIDIDKLTEKQFQNYLYTKGQPDPDLIIRPSGEFRTSNFLTWQSAYSEYIFDNILWPDFKPEHLDMAITEYNLRSRRFGGIQ